MLVKLVSPIGYVVAILMQVRGDKIQSEKENLIFLTLYFIHAHD